MPEVHITVADEGFELRGRLDGPEGGPGLVLCHPHPAFGGTMDTPLIVALAEAAGAAGMRTLRFCFRGIGGSRGRSEGGNAEHRDVCAATSFLRAELQADVAIAGYSFGALMATRALANGLSASRFAALALPTALIVGRDDRVADLRAAAAAQPSLFIGGDQDQFCDLPVLRGWTEEVATAAVDPLPGVSHFPTGPDLAELVRRTVAFLLPR